MASTRTIQSPGVEIREIDLSTRAITPVGTNVLVTGFAPQGPTYEIVELASLSDFQTVFGTPTNAAERYFYYAVNQLFIAGNNPTIKAVRIPYGANAGEGTSSNYSALAFPVIAIPSDVGTYPTSMMVTGGIPLASAAGYYFGQPALVALTEDQYNTISQNGLNWATTTGNIGLSSFVVSGANVLTNLANAGMVVVNTAKTTIDENFNGYYLNIADSFSNNPTTPYDDVVSVNTIGSHYFIDGSLSNIGAAQTYITVPGSRIGFTLSAAYLPSVDSISHDVENIPTYNIAASGYGDNVILSLFKLRPNPFSVNTNQLQYVLQEGYTGSFYVNRTIQDVNGGPAKSSYLQTVANAASNNIEIHINPNISNQMWLDDNGNAMRVTRVYKTTTGNDNDPFYTTAAAYLAKKPGTFLPANNLVSFGVYANSLPLNAAKVIGNVAAKLDTALNLAENTDVVDIDLTLDAGLSTIAAVQSVVANSMALADNPLYAQYDDTAIFTELTTQLNALTASNGNPVDNALTEGWGAVTNLFETFARTRRKDHLFISDPIRHIFVTGKNFKTLDNKANNFSQNIYWPLRNLYGTLNTSYATAYANWAKVQDIYSSQAVWLPFSGFAAAMITASDANNYVWTAPAGLNRGIINGLADIGVNPQQKQRDLLYKVSLNPVVYFPNEGYTVFGQKTLLKAPSAFDRINVRRLFLFLEKSALQTMKFFVFEPNTTFTQSRVVNTLTPVFELARNTQGVYDYLIVCNSSNNTPSVVDDNTLIVDIYIKPVRTAEFILVNFYATRTSQNFNELV
jgi:Phage tail sheath protein subtilisin-like domain/Phage tail sheath C-terminal domain